MDSAKAVVQRAYEAFGRRDVGAILALCADEVDWELVGPRSLAYSGPRRSRDEVGRFFAEIPRCDDIQVFEPREFIEAGEHVTVLGWERSKAIDTGKDYDTEWVHVVTVKAGRITRWRGFFDTAARYRV